MAITYSRGDAEQSVGSNAPQSTAHLTAIAIAVGIVFLVVVAGIWYGFSQSQKTIESVPGAILPPVSTPAIEQAKVYEAIDGLQQCQKNMADITTTVGQKKRENCYYAVMTIFSNASICELMTLDQASLSLCKQAETRFIKDYPNGIPPTIPAPNGNTINSNLSGNRGTGGGISSSNRNTNANGTVSQSATNTNTNSNTNTATNTNSSGNTNTVGSTNTSGNQNSNGNSNTNQTPNDKPVCVNDPNHVTLLEHTNNCQ